MTQEFQAPPSAGMSSWQVFRAPSVALAVGLALFVLRWQVSVRELHDAMQAVSYGMWTFAVVGLGEVVHRGLRRHGS